MFEDVRRDAMRRYIRDMAVSIATSTHREVLDREQVPNELRKLIHEIAALAADTAIQRYDVENRIIVAQAESFERAVAERAERNIPLSVLLAPR